MRKYISIIICTIVLVGCKPEATPLTKNIKSTDQTYMLGTLVHVTVYGKEVVKEEFDQIFTIISDIENKVSKNLPDSEISQLNRVKELAISEATYDIIKKGLYYGVASEGKFDITIAPLVNLWGIGSADARVPSQEEIDNVLGKIDYKRIAIDDKMRVITMEDTVELDLGGIAKGYVADKVSEYLRAHDMGHAIINLGGNILTVGRKPDGNPWRIGIQNPFDARGQKLGIVTIGQKSVVTSGIYERFLEDEGKEYHHILDPFTGYPVENSLASVSIISDYSVDGDGLSTMVFSMGLEKGYAYVEEVENVDAIFVTKNKEVYMTTGAKKMFQLTNYAFKKKKMK